MKAPLIGMCIAALVLPASTHCANRDDTGITADATPAEPMQAVPAQSQPAGNDDTTGDAAPGPQEAPAPSPAEAPAETTDEKPVAPTEETMPDAAATLPPISNEPEQALPAAQSEAEPESFGPAMLAQSVETRAQAQAQAKANVIAAAKTLNTPANTPANKSAIVAGANKPIGLPADTDAHVRFNQLAAKLTRPARYLGDRLPSQHTTMSLKLDNVGISNTDVSVRVHFAIRPQFGEWTNQSLAPDDTEEFSCGVEACLFSIRTGDNPVLKYTIQPRERYAIRWDGNKGIWDLRWTPSDK